MTYKHRPIKMNNLKYTSDKENCLFLTVTNTYEVNIFIYEFYNSLVKKLKIYE